MAELVDAEPCDAVVERRRGQSKSLRGAVRSRYPAARGLQGVFDHFALSGLESHIHIPRRRRALQRFSLHSERPVTREDDRALDDVFELPDIAGPVMGFE